MTHGISCAARSCVAFLLFYGKFAVVASCLLPYKGVYWNTGGMSLQEHYKKDIAEVMTWSWGSNCFVPHGKSHVIYFLKNFSKNMNLLRYWIVHLIGAGITLYIFVTLHRILLHLQEVHDGTDGI